jgi:hypothetical protein
LLTSLGVAETPVAQSFFCILTTATVPAGIVSPRPAWHALLWIVPLTVLWIVLVYWQPIIPASGCRVVEIFR